MPKKYAVRRTTKNRAPSRRKGPVSRTTTIQRNFAVADSQIVKLKYGDRFTLDAGAATPALYVFRANSIYDPNYTGTGHQPLSHDEWSVFYNHYIVIGAKIKVTFMARSASSVTGPALCSVSLHAGATSSTASDTAIIENAKNAWGFCGGVYSKSHLNLTKTYSPKTFFGKKVIQVGDTSGAQFGANPAEEAYWHIHVAGQDGVANPDAIDCVVQINYIVRLSERKSLNQS